MRVFRSKESKLPEENLLSLKQLTRFRANIVENVSSLKVQVIGLLDKVFPEYKKLFCDTFGTTSKQLLLNCPTPDDIIKISTTKLANLLSKHSKGKFNKDTALHIKEVAKESFGIKFNTDACSLSLFAISNEPELRTYYNKKISEGKHHFVALAGISRKLLTIIYYILKDDRDYIRYDNIKDKLN